MPKKAAKKAPKKPPKKDKEKGGRRPIWRGTVGFGLVQIPIALHSAQSPDELHFTMLDKRDHSQIKYERRSKVTEKIVPWNDIVKGYKTSEGYVLVTDADFKAANVHASETIDIHEFVDADSVDAIYFEKPYYLEPQHAGAKAYALLRAALKESGKVGIATFVMRSRQHIAALLVRDDVLMVQTLRYAHEVRDTADLAIPPTGARAQLVKKELEIAHRLVESMQGTFDIAKYKDSYRDDLLALIKRKQKRGEQTVVEEAPAPEGTDHAEVIDIMALLERSIAAKKSDPEGDPKDSHAGGKSKRKAVRKKA